MIERTHWDDCWKSGPAHYECAVGEVERLRARDEEWQRKASAWMASPEAAQRLEGYRELTRKLNAAEAEVERLRRDWNFEMDGRCSAQRDVLRLQTYLSEACERAKKWESEYSRLAGDYAEEAAYLRARAEKAEAEVERLREALVDLVDDICDREDMDDPSMNPGRRRAVADARAALDAARGES